MGCNWLDFNPAAGQHSGFVSKWKGLPMNSHPPFKSNEAQIEDLLRQMTLEEKVAMCHGDTIFTIPGVPRLGVPGMMFSDGPNGVREDQRLDGCGPANRTDDYVTALPTGLCVAAAWNPELARDFGVALGAETRARGKDVILGPSINIHRTPLCGRNFEYMGEDPCLVSALVAPLIRGIQAQGVAACVKHYALNNQELNRRGVDVEVDERTLREIYLAGFEAAVRQGGVLTVMGSYNKFRGRYCCQHDYLLDRVLKQDWGFQGLVVSDWGGVRDTAEAATSGIDVEMGSGNDYGKYYLADAYLAGLRDGRFPVALLDDKVRRILRVLQAIGKLGAGRRPAGAMNTATHQRTAWQVAAEGMVLLKNRGNVLPFDRAKIRTLAVIGENAALRHCRGGGSAEVKPLYEVTPLEALQEKLGTDVRIVHVQGYPDLADVVRPLPAECLIGSGALGGIRGWHQKCFTNPHFIGDPVWETVTPVVDFQMPFQSLVPGEASVEWKTEFMAPVSGEYEFTLCATEWTGFKLAGKWVCMTQSQVDSPAVFQGKVTLEAGQAYPLLVHSFIRSGQSSVRLGCRIPGASAQEPGTSSALQSAVGAALKADAVIFIGGLTHAQDTEGLDRKDLVLPFGQDALIQAVLKANPNTAIVLYGSGPVEMPWNERARALVLAWYPGMEGGRALADLLFGDANFSGKLPITMPRRLVDSPAHSVGEYRADTVRYIEGLNVGYRHFDARGIEPLFPFGHGLSYTRFAYKGLKIVAHKNAAAVGNSQDGHALAGRGRARASKIPQSSLPPVLMGQSPCRSSQGGGHDGNRCGAALLSVFCTVRNSGARAGAEVVQCYLSAEGGRLPRPVRELKAFRKVFLQPGESTTVRMDLDQRALSVYDPEQAAWVLDAVRFRIAVGASSRDLRLVGEVCLPVRGVSLGQ